MDENSSAEVSPQQMVSESSGTGRSCSGIKRERGPYKALSVVRVSTKLQLQRRNSLGHARVVEDEENDDQAFEEEPTAMDEPSLRRRAISGSPPSSRLLGRHRGAVAAAPVEGPRRNAPRGEWTQAEEAVLARKHMELGNKWTTISQFLPSRTDNDVKNIWHSTLRSKNSERRSFLRTYARAVRDCANDAEARKQAYEMAQRVCGAPQPIEAALAAVQEQYQLQLQIQAAQQDEEALEDGMSPEAHQDMEADTNGCGVQVATSYEPGDLALHSAVEIVHDRSPPAMSPAQQALEPLPDMFRPSTSSRSNSAAESGQHSGVGMATGAGGRGRVSTAPSPLNQRSAPLTTTPSVAAIQPCPGPLDTVDASSVPSNGDLQTYPSAIPCRTLATSRSLCQPYTPSHGAATTTTTTTTTTTATDAAAAAVAAAAVAVNPGLPFGSRGEVESTCLVRLSSLQIADQLHRQQQQQHLLQQQQQQQMLIQQHQLQQQQLRNQQHQQQLMMVSTLQSHDLLPSGMGSGPGTSASSPTNYQVATTPAPNTYHPHLQGRGSTNGMAPVMPSLSSPQDQATTAATSTAAVNPSTGMPSVLGGCGSASAGGSGDAGTIDLDDLLVLGLDLTPEDLAVLSRGGQSSATPGGGISSGGGGMDGMQMPDASQISQQMLGSHMNTGCSVLGATTSISPQNDQPVGHLGGSLGNSGSELLPIQQHLHMHLQAQPPHSHTFDAFSAFLTDMEQKQRCLALQNQLQHQPQQPGSDCYGMLQHSQQQQQLQQHHMLQMGNDDMSGFGMGSGSGYRCPRGMLEGSGGRASASGGVGVTRTGYMVQHNTGCTEFHGLINCSSNYEMPSSGQQPYLDPTRMPLAPQQSMIAPGGGAGDAGRVSIQGFFAPVHEGFSSNNSLLAPMGLGMDQGMGIGMGMGMGPTAGGSQYPCGPMSSPPKLWPGSCSGAGPSWAAGLLHPDTCTASDARTMSPFGNDTAQAQVSGQVPDGTVGATCSAYMTMPTAGGGCSSAAGSGGSGGLAGRGSGPYDTTIPNSISLPPALDNITMGLDSGNLLDCLMDVDLDGAAGDGVAAVGAGGSGSSAGGDSFDYMMRAMMRRTTRPSPLCPWQPLGQQQHQGQHQQQHEQGSVGSHLQDAMMGGVGGSRSSGLLASGGSPATGSGGPQPCQPAGMGMPYSSVRMGPMLRL